MSSPDGRGAAAASGREERTERPADAASTKVSLLSTWHQHVFAHVESWRWLHALDDTVAGWLRPLHDRYQDTTAVEIMHGGRWTGHALHPALSDLPVGLWTGASLLDVLGQDAGHRRGGGPAASLSAAGMLAAVATATTGINDWTVSDDDDRRIGLLHGLLNAVGMTLQGGSLGARFFGRRRTAQALGLASLGVTAGAAYAGGHLVQGRAVMVNHVAWFTGPQRWTRALADDDLAEGVPAGVEVAGRRILLLRRGGALYALDNTCSHAGGLLSRGEVSGDVSGDVVTCPLHGSRFDLRDGQVRRGPAHHPQPVLPTRVRDGWIEVRGSAPQPRRRSPESS